MKESQSIEDIDSKMSSFQNFSLRLLLCIWCSIEDSNARPPIRSHAQLHTHINLLSISLRNQKIPLVQTTMDAEKYTLYLHATSTATELVPKYCCRPHTKPMDSSCLQCCNHGNIHAHIFFF